MIIGGVEFLELVSAGNRSPAEQGSRDSVDITRTYWQPGRVDEEARMLARAAFLGYAELLEEASAVAGDYLGMKRRWVERKLPHAYVTAGGPWDTGNDPYIYASWAECEPMTGHQAAAAFPEVGPTADKGLLWRVRYSNWPWIYRPDADVLAANGPLAADGGGTALFPGLPARPHEGIALESGWLNSRYVARFTRHAGKNVSLPNGFMEFITQAADPVSPGAAKQSLPYGLPFHHFKMDVEYHWWTPLAAIPHEVIGRLLNMTCNDAAFDFAPAGTLTLKDYEWNEFQGYVGSTRMALVRYKMRYEPNYDTPAAAFQGVNSAYRSVDGRLRFWPYRPQTGGAVVPSPVFRSVDYADLFIPPQEVV